MKKLYRLLFLLPSLLAFAQQPDKYTVFLADSNGMTRIVRVRFAAGLQLDLDSDGQNATLRLVQQVSTATLAAGVLDVRQVDSQTLTIGSGCSTVQPCTIRFATASFQFLAPATVKIASGAGAIWIDVSRAGSIEVGAAAAGPTISCSSGCTVTSSGSFPPGSIPIARWNATNGTWTGGENWRADQSAFWVDTGAGLISTAGPAGPTIAVDSTSVLTRVAPPATSTVPCGGGEFAINDQYFYTCVRPNTWRRSPWDSAPF